MENRGAKGRVRPQSQVELNPSSESNPTSVNLRRPKVPTAPCHILPSISGISGSPVIVGPSLCHQRGFRRLSDGKEPLATSSSAAVSSNTGYDAQIVMTHMYLFLLPKCMELSVGKMHQIRA